MLNPVIRKMRQGSGLSEADEAMILESLKVTTRNKASVNLVQEGDTPDGLLLVLEGFACRYKSVKGGASQIVAFMVPGDFCDIHAELLREMDHSIATLGACRFATIPRATVEDWMVKSAAIRRAVDWATLVDEAILREWLANLGARDAFIRTAHLFCELRVRLEAVGIGDQWGFALPLTQAELSNALGLSIVHINRVLRRLRDEGLATFKGGAVKIPDAGRLIEVAGFRSNYLHQSPREQQAAV